MCQRATTLYLPESVLVMYQIPLIWTLSLKKQEIQYYHQSCGKIMLFNSATTVCLYKLRSMAINTQGHGVQIPSPPLHTNPASLLVTQKSYFHLVVLFLCLLFVF